MESGFQSTVYVPPSTYRCVTTIARAAQQAQWAPRGARQGTTKRRARGSRTHLPGRPGAVRSRRRNSRSPLFVMQMQGKRRKPQDASSRAAVARPQARPLANRREQGRVTVRTESSLWKNGVRCSVPCESVAYRPENLMPRVQFELSVR